MAWRDNVDASPANIRKRIRAAVDALEGAQRLMLRRNDMSESMKSASNAIAWAHDADSKTMVIRRRRR